MVDNGQITNNGRQINDVWNGLWFFDKLPVYRYMICDLPIKNDVFVAREKSQIGFNVSPSTIMGIYILWVRSGKLTITMGNHHVQ